MIFQFAGEALTGDQPRTGEIEIQKAEYPPRRKASREVLKAIQISGHKASAGDGADGCTGYNVRLKASGDQSI
jgi:hypothetical protein